MANATPFASVNLHPGANLAQNPATESKFEGGMIVRKLPDGFRASDYFKTSYAGSAAGEVLKKIWNMKAWQVNFACDIESVITNDGVDEVDPPTNFSASLEASGQFITAQAQLYADYGTGDGHAILVAYKEQDKPPVWQVDGRLKKMTSIAPTNTYEEPVESTTDIQESWVLPSVAVYADPEEILDKIYTFDRTFDGGNVSASGVTKTTSYWGFGIGIRFALIVFTNTGIDLYSKIWPLGGEAHYPVPFCNEVIPADDGEMYVTIFGVETEKKGKFVFIYPISHSVSSASLTYDINVTEWWTYPA